MGCSSCCNEGGCCDPATMDWSKHGQNGIGAQKGSVIFDKAITWTHLILTPKMMREFHASHPKVAKAVSLILSPVRFALQKATEPLITAVSLVVLPILEGLARGGLITRRHAPGAYMAAAGWALFNAILWTGIILIALKVPLTSNWGITCIVFYGVWNLGKLINEFSRGWNVPMDEHANTREFCGEATVLNTGRITCCGAWADRCT